MINISFSTIIGTILARVRYDQSCVDPFGDCKNDWIIYDLKESQNKWCFILRYDAKATVPTLGMLEKRTVAFT